MAATMGLLGLISFLSILAVFFYLCFGYLRRAAADIDKLLLIAMVAGMAQYMADIFFNLSTISPELVFWLILAMTPVIGRLIMNKGPARAEFKGTAQLKSSVTPYANRTRAFLSLGCAVALIIVGISMASRPFLADMYLKKGLKLQKAINDQAIYAFDTATKIQPEEAAYWHVLGVYSDSVARRVNKEPLKTEILSFATKSFNKALELNSYFAFEHYYVADVYTYWTEKGAIDKWPEALSLYDKASQLFPNNAVILNKWSLALIIKGDLDEAQKKLDYAASVDPGWANTSFLTGLLLAKEGENDKAAAKIIAPIQDNSGNLKYFIELCYDLAQYGMVTPLDDALKTYAQTVPSEWITHAMLGVTSLFVDSLDKSLDECNSAMRLVPGENVSDLFLTILRLSSMSPDFKKLLPGTASEWRAKLSQSPQHEALLQALDKFVLDSE